MPRVQSHGVSIYYEVHGSGSAVVFAHGMGGNAMSWWQQVPHFARRYRVISFDHRGFARSPCPAPEFLPGRFADDLLAILDREGIGRAALVCQSMGGWTGMSLARSAPQRVSALVLCSTPGGVDTPGIREARGRIAAGLAREGGAVRGNLALAPDYPEREPEKALLYDQINALNPGVPPDALTRLGGPESLIQPEELAGWTTPTLVLACQHDQLFPPQAIREVAASIPGAELHDFAGVGHSSYFEDPKAFNALVGAFLARHAS